MRYKVAIVDDEKQSIELVKNYLHYYAQKNKVFFDVFEYEDGDQLIEDYITDLDIVFLDIEMKRLDGMKTAEKIRNFDHNVIIIFITNMAQYAIKGYAVDALSFLLKPLKYFTFSSELTRSLAKISNKKEFNLAVKTQSETHKLSTNDIDYIEVMKHTIMIHANKMTYSLRGTMKEFEKILEPYYFIRSNHCYLVNLAKVKSIVDDFVIVGDAELKLSRSRKKVFMEALTSYVGRVI
ncbi:MAG: LytR/AlgR family response regulator transcription factor [Candidatus Izemoplasmataceae bacterium]